MLVIELVAPLLPLVLFPFSPRSILLPPRPLPPPLMAHGTIVRQHQTSLCALLVPLESFVGVDDITVRGGVQQGDIRAEVCGPEVLPANITYVVFLQQSPLLALSSKFLSPSCAPDLGNIATCFFRKNISIRYQNMCYNGVIFWEL